MESCSLFTEKLGQIQTQCEELKVQLDKLLTTGKEDSAASVTRLSKQLQQTQNSFVEQYQENVQDLIRAWYGADAESKVLKKIQFTYTGRVDYMDLSSLNLAGKEYVPFLFRNIKNLIVPVTLSNLGAVEEVDTLEITPVRTASGDPVDHPQHDFALSALELRKVNRQLICRTNIASLSFSKLKECPVFTADKIQKIDLASFEKGGLNIYGDNIDLSLPSFTNGSLRTNARKINVPVLSAAKTIQLSGNGESAHFPQLREVENILSIQSIGTLYIPHFQKGRLTIEHASELDMSEVTEHNGGMALHNIGRIKAAKLERLGGLLNITGLPSGELSQLLPALKHIGEGKEDDEIVLRRDQWNQLELLVERSNIALNIKSYIAEPFPGISYQQLLPFLYRSVQELYDKTGHEIILTGTIGHHLLLETQTLIDANGNTIPLTNTEIIALNRNWYDDSRLGLTFFDSTDPSSQLELDPIHFYNVPSAFISSGRQIQIFDNDISNLLFPYQVDQSCIAYATVGNNRFPVLRPELAFVLPFFERDSLEEETLEFMDTIVQKYSCDIDIIADYLLHSYYISISTFEKIENLQNNSFKGIQNLLNQLQENLQNKATSYFDDSEWIKKHTLPELLSILQYIYLSPLPNDEDKQKITQIMQLPIEANFSFEEMNRFLSEVVRQATNEETNGSFVQELMHVFPDKPEDVVRLTYTITNRICERSKAINDPTSPLFQSDAIFAWTFSVRRLIKSTDTVEAIESRIEKVFACKSLAEAERLLLST